MFQPTQPRSFPLKTLITSAFLSFFVVTTAGAAPATPESVSKKIIQSLQKLENNETEYLVLWAGNANEAEEMFVEGSVCSQAENYKEESSSQLGEFLKEIVNLKVSSDEIRKNSKLVESAKAQAQKLSSQLEKAFEGKDLTVCTDLDGGPYSDGAEVKFVQVNGKLLFYFGYGRPD